MKNNFKRNLLKIIILLIIMIIFARAVMFFVGGDESALTKDSVVSIKLEGVILSSDEFIGELKKYAENDRVKGIILRIDSPGGAITPTQEIFRYITKINKPVYASMSSLAASGGYYAAAACDKIYALPSTITGSIGVIMTLSNVEELLGKIGLKSIVIKSGKFKDVGNASRPMTAEERQFLQDMVMELYNQFVGDIKKRRNIPEDVIKKYADGRIFTGNFAKEHGFVDTIGTYDEAFIEMKNELNMPNLELRHHIKKKSLKDEFLSKFNGLIPDQAVQNKHGFYYLYTPSY